MRSSLQPLRIVIVLAVHTGSSRLSRKALNLYPKLVTPLPPARLLQAAVPLPTSA